MLFSFAVSSGHKRSIGLNENIFHFPVVEVQSIVSINIPPPLFRNQ